MMHTVKSSNIAKVGHDGRALIVEFTNGSTYQYEGVPAHELQPLLRAKSVGAHFAANIRDRYIGKRV